MESRPALVGKVCIKETRDKDVEFWAGRLLPSPATQIVVDSSTLFEGVAATMGNDNNKFVKCFQLVCTPVVDDSPQRRIGALECAAEKGQWGSIRKHRGL